MELCLFFNVGTCAPLASHQKGWTARVRLFCKESEWVVFAFDLFILIFNKIWKIFKQTKFDADMFKQCFQPLGLLIFIYSAYQFRLYDPASIGTIRKVNFPSSLS